MKVLILDTETTGLTLTDEVIELAWIRVSDSITEFNKDAVSTYNQRYRPNARMNPHAQKVHGIAFRDLLRCPSTKNIDLPEDINYIIGHNIEFDARLLKQSNIELTLKLNGVKYICTKKLVKVIEKQFKIPFLNHKLDTVIRHYYPDKVHELIPEKHEALSDCYKCFLVLQEVLKLVPAIDSWDKLYELQNLFDKTK